MAAPASAGGAGASDLRRAIFEAGKDAVEKRGEELKERISKYTDTGESMDTSQSLDLQFEVGEYNNLVQAVTGMEKMMKDSIGAISRNTT